jgi:hypothetical protein
LKVLLNLLLLCSFSLVCYVFCVVVRQQFLGKMSGSEDKELEEEEEDDEEIIGGKRKVLFLPFAWFGSSSSPAAAALRLRFFMAALPPL